MRAAFAAHGGEEVDTQGDSFFYVFSRARDGALAAVDAQRALAAHEWPGGVGVRIRIGMHTGEPVVSEEGYHGIGVHRAARIMAAGHGGQVLMAEATAAVLADEEVPGIGVRDLGRQITTDQTVGFGKHNLEVAATLRRLGYRVFVKHYATDQAYFGPLSSDWRHVDAGISGWIQDYPAPSNFFSGIVCPGNALFCSVAYRRRLARTNAATASSGSNAPSTAFDRYATNLAAAVPFMNPKATDFVSKRLGNYQHHPEFGILIGQVWVR